MLNMSSYSERNIKNLRIQVYALIEKARNVGESARLPPGLLNAMA